MPCLIRQQPQYYQLMKNFQDEQYQLWKSKCELAKEGDLAATTQLKQRLASQQESEHPILSASLKTLLQQSKVYQVDKEETYGPYDLYSKVPTFLLLNGKAVIQCINTEGDNEILKTVQRGGILEASEGMLRAKYGQNNIALVTQFEIVGLQKSVLVELSPKAILAALKYLDDNKITLKEEIIMRKHMLIALKHITKLAYTRGASLNEKFYLLDGRISYYHSKTKNVLCCYEEGYFNPHQFHNTDIKLFVFQGSVLMMLENEMMKDEVALGIESKREEHLMAVVKKYEKMSGEECGKMQEKLIAKYKLNRKEVDREIYGIEKTEKMEKTEKGSKTKTDLTTTNTSMKDTMKDKCGIRIRKAKKV